MLNIAAILEQARNPLQSIFHSLEGGGHGSETLYQSKVVSLEDLPFDNASSSFPEDAFGREKQAVDEIKDENARAFTELFLLLKYGSRIGSSNAKDVPFADHERVRAALEVASNKAGGKVVILKGDLTGIQEYLYGDIDLGQVGGARRIARRLRGKSFFVSLLSDFCAEVFLGELGLPQVCLLFSGGGHFNLLLPAIGQLEAQLEKLHQQLNYWLAENYGMHLGLALGWSDEFTVGEGQLVKQFQQAKVRCAIGKYRKAGVLPDIFGDDFPFKQTGKRPAEDDTLNVIGQQAPRTEYLVQLQSNNQLQLAKGLVAIQFDVPGGGNHALCLATSEDNIEEILNPNKTSISSAQVIRLNSLDFLDVAPRLKGKFNFPLGYGFRLVGKEAPFQQNKEIMELGDISALCHPSVRNKPLDYPQLAALRLDVDDLGFIFEHGFGKKATLERIAALSRELHFFFGGYLNLLAREWNIYVVYSGGDDAFVLGSWVNIYHFAKRMEEAFRSFTKGHPNIHFSAGIYTCNPHYPIARLADDAKEQLDDFAKELDGKNAIRVFAHTLPWEEFHQMTNFAKVLLKYMPEEGEEASKPGKLARSLVRRILQLVRSCFYQDETADVGMYKRTVKVHPIRFAKHKSHLRYLLARHGYNQEVVENAAEGLARDVFQEFISGNFTKKALMKNYTVALNYVLQISRKSKN